MISEILTVRRTALAALLPLVTGAGVVAGSMPASAAPHPTQLSAPEEPAQAPTPTPCPRPKGFMAPSAQQQVAPQVMLANHQACAHHEKMATAFRWL